MTKEDAIRDALALVNKAGTAMVGSNSQDGYPHIKAMFKMENEGLVTVWFSTNTSSQRVTAFRNDRRACVYFVDMEEARGLMLVGDMQVRDDLECRQRIWREGYERYYPLGVTDPDYAVLRFTAHSGKYYHNLEKITFDVSRRSVQEE